MCCAAVRHVAVKRYFGLLDVVRVFVYFTYHLDMYRRPETLAAIGVCSAGGNQVSSSGSEQRLAVVPWQLR